MNEFYESLSELLKKYDIWKLLNPDKKRWLDDDWDYFIDGSYKDSFFTLIRPFAAIDNDGTVSRDQKKNKKNTEAFLETMQKELNNKKILLERRILTDNEFILELDRFELNISLIKSEKHVPIEELEKLLKFAKDYLIVANHPLKTYALNTPAHTKRLIALNRVIETVFDEELVAAEMGQKESAVKIRQQAVSHAKEILGPAKPRSKCKKRLHNAVFVAAHSSLVLSGCAYMPTMTMGKVLPLLLVGSLILGPWGPWVAFSFALLAFPLMLWLGRKLSMKILGYGERELRDCDTRDVANDLTYKMLVEVERINKIRNKDALQSNQSAAHEAAHPHSP